MQLLWMQAAVKIDEEEDEEETDMEILAMKSKETFLKFLCIALLIVPIITTGKEHGRKANACACVFIGINLKNPTNPSATTYVAAKLRGMSQANPCGTSPQLILLANVSPGCFLGNRLKLVFTTKRHLRGAMILKNCAVLGHTASLEGLTTFRCWAKN